MDKPLIGQALQDARRPLKPAKNSSPSTRNASDSAERMRIFTKLFTLYPLAATQNPKAAIAAFVDETADVPVYWIASGLARLTKESDRRFAPSLGEIRGAALRAIRAARWARDGAPPVSPHGEPPLHPARELEWAASRPRMPQVESGL